MSGKAFQGLLELGAIIVASYLIGSQYGFQTGLAMGIFGWAVKPAYY